MGTVLRWTAFTLMALFGVLGALFVAGETFADPGGWAAVGMVAGWLLPMVALIVYALIRKERAGPVFVVVAALVAAFTLIDETATVVPRDDAGPVVAVTVFSLGVALAFLGLHRSTLAGALMMGLAVVQLGAQVLGAMVRGGLADGPPVSSMLTNSSGIVVVPLLVVGALFLAAGAATHEHLRIGRGPTARPAH